MGDTLKVFQVFLVASTQNPNFISCNQEDFLYCIWSSYYIVNKNLTIHTRSSMTLLPIWLLRVWCSTNWASQALLIWILNNGTLVMLNNQLLGKRCMHAYICSHLLKSYWYKGYKANNLQTITKYIIFIMNSN